MKTPISVLAALSLWVFGGLCSVARAEPPLQVGFAEIDLTPKLDGKPVFLAGFGLNRKATGVLDPIMARAVVLAHGEEKLALVSVDVVGLFHPVVERVRKELPGFGHVLVSSTHNHEGPDTLGIWGPNPFTCGLDPDYLRGLEAKLVAVVRAADAAARPASARIGTTRAPELLTDNRKPLVKHDELVAIEFRDPKTARTTGLLVQWNCHPETLGDRNTRLSADYVATTVARLRTRFDCPVAYFTGTVGGLLTSLAVEITDARGKKLADGTVEKTVRYGERLAEVAARAVATAKPVTLTPFTLRRSELLLPIDNKLYQLAWKLGVLKRDLFVWTGDPRPAQRLPLQDLTKRPAVRTEVGYLRLGELEVAVVPGEIYPELVLGGIPDPAEPGADFPEAPAEPPLYAQLKSPYRMLIGLGNDEIGYIIPRRQWDQEPPFCYGRNKSQYGEENSIGPEAAPIVCAAFRTLVQDRK